MSNIRIKDVQPRLHKQAEPVFTKSTYSFLDNVQAKRAYFPQVNNWADTVLMPKIVYYGKEDNADTKIKHLNIHKYQRHDTDTLDTLTSKDDSVSFRTYRFLPKSFHYHGITYHSYDPQGIAITSGHNGRPANAYICINATSSDSDIDFIDKDNGDEVVQIIRCELSNHQGTVQPTGDIQVGPPIDGGHGQTFALNPVSNELWLYKTAGGTEPSGGMMKIDKSTLAPSHYGEIAFSIGRSRREKEWGNSGYRFGDDLCFDGQGRFINICPDTKGDSPIVPQYALKIYRGELNYGEPFKAHIVKQFISNAGGIVIQGTAYNPRNDRLYVIYDNAILSFPSNKLGNLSASDIHQTIFNGYRESEGLAFDKLGNAYLLTDRSPEILKCPWKDVRNM